MFQRSIFVQNRHAAYSAGMIKAKRYSAPLIFRIAHGPLNASGSLAGLVGIDNAQTGGTGAADAERRAARTQRSSFRAIILVDQMAAVGLVQPIIQ